MTGGCQAFPLLCAIPHGVFFLLSLSPRSSIALSTLGGARVSDVFSASGRLWREQWERQSSFRTEVDLPVWPRHALLDYDDDFVLLGSCFSENIGVRLSRAKLRTAVNPGHGLLFSPLSICSSLDRMIAGVGYEDRDANIVFSEGKGLWCSLDHHSTFDSTSRKGCLDNINAGLATGRSRLLSATCIFITLGTAWMFRHNETEQDVANCHKLPSYSFDRHIVSVEDIAQALDKSISNLLRANPNARVVLTVSPVRHWRDGPVDNARSKAHLLAAAHDAIETLKLAKSGDDSGTGNVGRVSYFPAYEIMNDDLRDYRFYEPDMIHPNSVAVDYVWNKMLNSMFSDEAINTMAEVRKILQATQHRPFNVNSDAHKAFLRGRLQKIDNFRRLHPQLQLDREREFFELQLQERTVAPSS